MPKSNLVEKSNQLPNLPDFDKGTLVQLDLEGFIAQGKKAKKEGSGSINSSEQVLLPMPDHRFERFQLLESPLMEPALAAKFPEIKTYLLKGVDDPHTTGRLVVGPDGFGAYFSSLPNGKEVFIRKVSKTNNNQYLSFWGKDDPSLEAPFVCSHEGAEEALKAGDNLKNMNMVNETGDELRVFRMAITTVGELSEQQGWTTTAQALAGVLNDIAALNVVYERDASVRFVLPENEDLLLFLNSATDPFMVEDGSQMLNDNHIVVTQMLGSENFDIGMVLVKGSGCCAAALNSICNDNAKGGNFSKYGGLYLTAHEIGHQFSCQHTWAYCGGLGSNTQSQVNELGSGTSIMAYGGAGCGDDNITPTGSLTFFGVSSQIAMTNHIDSKSCYKTLPSGNNIPVVTVPTGGFHIPKSTPFSLTGSATDTDNDDLTYSWEQSNMGGIDFTATQPLNTYPTSGNVPIFRIFNPTTSPTRTFPQLPEILQNISNVNEKLPTYTRNLKFRLFVRDNHPGAGGTASAEVSFNVDGTAGPFLVTAPNTCVTWASGSSQTVTWDVANTTNANVNCQNVKISLSVDGGYTYPHVLAASTPNDGSHAVTLPSGICSNKSRIKVEAVGNIFFDISNADINIEAGTPVVRANDLLFDGSDDYVEVDNTTLGNFGTGDFTVEMWVKTAQTGTVSLINKRSICNVGDFWTLSLNNGVVKGELYNTTNGYSPLNFTGATVINDNNWHHVAITRSGTSFKVYVDGQQDGSHTTSQVHNLTNGAKAAMGFMPICGAGSFGGNLDEVRVWSVARTQAEIDGNKNCALVGNEAGLLAYYPMDEPECGNCATSGTFIDDKSTNSNTATLKNGTMVLLSTVNVQLQCPTCTAGTITISSQPSNATVAAGATATFSVTTSAGSNIFYQWQLSTNGGTTFSPIQGATGSSYSFTVTAAQGGNQYRCLLVNGCDVETSSAATLTLSCPAPSALGTITGPSAPCQNNYYTYYVSPNAAIETWTWTAPSGWTLVNQGNMAIVKVGSGSGNVTVFGTNYCGQNTPTSTLAVNPALVAFSTQPTSQTVNEGAPASFSVAVTTGGGTTGYQWQQSHDGGLTYSNISAATAATYTIAAAQLAQDDRQYRCLVSNQCFADTSNVANLTVNCVSSAPALPSEIIGAAIVCSGTTMTFMVAPVPGASSYVWTLPAGWTGSSTTNSISVTTSSSGGLLKVKGSNACGMGPERSFNVVVSNAACGRSVHFDGDDHLKIGQNGIDLIGDLTISFWVYPEHFNEDQTLIFNGREFVVTLKLGGNIMYRHGSPPNGGYNTDYNHTFSTGLSVGKWQHITITRDLAAKEIACYRKGVLVGTDVYPTGNPSPNQNSPDPSPNTDYDMIFGAGILGDYQHFQGRLDDIKIWDTKRSASDITLDVYCTPVGNETNLKAYYGFEVGNINGNNAALTSLPNAVGSSYPAATPHQLALNGPTSNITDGGKGNGAITGSSLVCPNAAGIEYSIDLPGTPSVTWTLPAGWSGSSTTETITVNTGANGGLLVASAALSCGTVAFEINVSTAVPLTNNDFLDGVALDFDGTNDHLQVTDNTVGNFGTGDFTVEFWLKTTDSYGGLAGKLDGCESNWELVLGSGKVEFRPLNGTAIISASTVNNGQWRHIAVTRSGTTVTIYIDGVSNATGTSAHNLTNGAQMVLGTRFNCDTNAGRHLAGQLDEFRTWSTARSQQQIQDFMFCPIGCAPPALKLYLPFEDGTPGGSSQTTTADYSLNSETVSLLNFNYNPTSSNFVNGQTTPEITGAPIACPNSTGVVYAVNFFGTPSVTWTVPSGWAITAGQGTESITVTAGATGGTITAVADLGDCNATVNKAVSTTPPLSNDTFLDGVAIDLDGTNDYIEVADNTVGNFGTGDFTVECWVKTTDSYGGIIMKHQSGDGDYLDVFIGSNKVRYQDGQLNLDGNIVVNNDQWHHIAVTRSGTAVTIYVDGTLDISGTSSQNINNNGLLHFGNRDNRDGNADYDGQLDEVRIWNIARTQQQIQDFILCPIGCAPPSMLLYLPFEDGTPGGSSQTTTADYSVYAETVNLLNFNYNATSSNFVNGQATPEITGAPIACPNSTGVVYSLNFIGTPTVTWTVPSGWTITAGQGTESITVTAGATGGTITAVADLGDCEATVNKAVSTTPPLSNNEFLDGVSLDFDGTNDYLEVADNTVGNFGTGNFTVEFWLKTTDSYGGLAGKLDGCGTNWEMLLRFGTGKIDFAPPSDPPIQGNIAVNDGTWHHVAVVRSGTTLSIYIDGVLDISGTTDDNLTNNALMRFGTRFNCDGSSSRYFDGEMDEIRIWSTARTLQQLRDFMFCPIDCAPASMLLYLPFEDGTPGGSSQATTADYSVYSETVNLLNFNYNPTSSNFVNGQVSPTMTGPATACQGSSVVYGITLVGSNNTITWTVPSGWVIATGQGTESITVTAGSTSGNITATLGCGSVSFQKAVTGSVNTNYYHDEDGDGFGDNGDPYSNNPTCTPPANYVANNTDCDDTDPFEFPGQTWYIDADGDDYGVSSTTACLRPANGFLLSELSGNGTDDCDDTDPNERPGQTWYIDADGDDYGVSSTTACLRPANGFLLSELSGNGTDDCDDTDPNERPGQTWYIDADGDDYGVSSTTACLRPANGFLLSELSGNGTDDCDDTDPNERPGQTWYIDADGDDYGVSSTTACLRPANGFLLSELSGNGTDDCDDTDPNERPGQTWYIDADGDDYGVSSTTACLRPTNGFLLSELSGNGTDDCDDTDPNERPGQTWYIDADGDDYGVSSTTACLRPANGFLLSELSGNGTDDCDDTDPFEFPGQTWYIDADGDDYGVSSTTACLRPANGFLLGELSGNGTDDCNDGNSSIHPGATEVCANNIDDDCDGNIDEGCAGNDFITIWKTDNPGTSATNQITIPTTGTGYNYNIYWEKVGEPTTNGTLTGQTGSTTITFPSVGSYLVKITGTFPRIFFNNGGDRRKLLSIEQWGTIQWSSMQSAFYGCSNLVLNATDSPNLTTVTSMANMFRGATAFNGNIAAWNTANVTDMNLMFNLATSFNQNIGSWNTANVTNMSGMFNGATSFNQSLNSWNVSKVTNFGGMFFQATSFNGSIGAWTLNAVGSVDMNNMFNGATAFNQNIGAWNTTKVTNMANLFFSATAFNQNIGGWNTASVFNMGSMFRGATSFNGNIGGWNTALVTGMGSMFYDATAFNQNLGSWNTAKVTSMSNMFRGATSFNGDISSWQLNTTVGSQVNLSGMFLDATAFNQNIGSWNTIEVTNMSAMFQGATAFNQNIGGWNTAKVVNMAQMFQGATAFNQNIGGWNTANVVSMALMFQGGTNFNQNLGNWALNATVNMTTMLNSSGLSVANYDNTLIGWAANPSTPNGRSLGASGLKYCNGQAARTFLDIDKAWTISGDIYECPAPEIAVADASGDNIADGSTTPSPTNDTDFGSVCEAGGTQSFTYTISNTGTANLNLSGMPLVEISGTNAADFTVTLQPSSPVIPNGSTTLTVEFNPSGAGLRTASVSISNNDSNENPFNFAIQGTGNAASTWYDDDDGDTYGDPNDSQLACSQPVGHVANNTDCDDTDPFEFPGQTWYIDADGDDYGVSSTTACLRPTNGFLLSELSGNGTDDCDDTDPFEFPGQTWYIDADGDDYGVSSTISCLRPTNGFPLSELSGNGTDDCNDGNSSIHPGATEVCNNGIDDDCDTNIDEGCEPEMNVKGLGVSIVDGDITPSVPDDTEYGSVATGSSVVHTFTIENTGNANLTISSISIGNTTDFAVTQAVASSVAPAGSTTFTVTFNPQSTGVKTTTVTINNNDANENPYNFNVQGTGFTVGAALDFDGVNDFVTVPNGTNLMLGNTMSISGWVYPSNNNPTWPDFDGFFGWRNDSNADFYLLQFNNATTLEGRFRNSAGVAFDITANVLTLDTWQHLALTYDGTSLKMYRNGVLVGSTAANGSLANPSVPFFIGKIVFSSFNFYLKGRLDEVRFWDKALSCSEIVHFMDCELTGSETGLAAYYRINQGVAGGNNTSITQLTATTGPNGSLVGFAMNGSTSNFVAPGGVVSGNSCTAPTNPSVSGSPVVCAALNATYSVTVPGATAYAWTLPSGWTGTSTTSSITVTTSTSSGNVQCVVTLPCGNLTLSKAVTVVAEPSISTQPSPQTQCVGSNVSFNVVATGNDLTYQWRKNGTPLSNGGSTSGATSAALTITGIAAGDAGNYDVVLTDTCGSTLTSNAAGLTVTTNATLTLSNVFIEGYMTSATTMQPVMLNAVNAGGTVPGNPTPTATQCDYITVELHNSAPPHDLAYTQQVILSTTGGATVNFPCAAVGGSYYIVIKGSKTIETWSAAPQTVGVTYSYNFDNAADAYGNNMTTVFGVPAIYTGDIDDANANGFGDGEIEFQDYDAWSADNGSVGYLRSDMNGDGEVEFQDYDVFVANNGITAIVP
ncbi:MAG: BspA family leucine-rich repeat surface protein [Saprospiraceae bacterium]|nr:BspA family leucine-rich repeat surface protein [Saprospiraceae bacterium]